MSHPRLVCPHSTSALTIPLPSVETQNPSSAPAHSVPTYKGAPKEGERTRTVGLRTVPSTQDKDKSEVTSHFQYSGHGRTNPAKIRLFFSDTNLNETEISPAKTITSKVK